MLGMYRKICIRSPNACAFSFDVKGVTRALEICVVWSSVEELKMWAWSREYREHILIK